MAHHRATFDVHLHRGTLQDMKRKAHKIHKVSLPYSVFYEEAQEGGYVAFVPALPGCHTQGETLEEAESNVKETIEVYLESLAAHKDPIPKEGRSFQGTVKVSVPVRS